MELHGAAAQMNILLENHGTSSTVIAGLTMTLKVFRTDATFVERVHRYAFTVLMKGHTTLWDAIEELRRSVREKYGVEHVHLQYGSEELQICEWMAVLTINIHLYAYSYPIRD